MLGRPSVPSERLGYPGFLLHGRQAHDPPEHAVHHDWFGQWVPKTGDHCLGRGREPQKAQYLRDPST